MSRSPSEESTHIPPLHVQPLSHLDDFYDSLPSPPISPHHQVQPLAHLDNFYDSAPSPSPPHSADFSSGGSRANSPQTTPRGSEQDGESLKGGKGFLAKTTSPIRHLFGPQSPTPQDSSSRKGGLPPPEIRVVSFDEPSLQQPVEPQSSQDSDDTVILASPKHGERTNVNSPPAENNEPESDSHKLIPSEWSFEEEMDLGGGKAYSAMKPHGSPGRRLPRQSAVRFSVGEDDLFGEQNLPHLSPSFRQKLVHPRLSSIKPGFHDDSVSNSFDSGSLSGGRVGGLARKWRGSIKTMSNPLSEPLLHRQSVHPHSTDDDRHRKSRQYAFQKPIFVELYEFIAAADKLDQNGLPCAGETVWQETARWLKYEEDVEGMDHHFGRPHVAPLSFHSLILLRRCISKGTILLELEEATFFGVCDRVATEMVEASRTKPNEVPDEKIKESILRVLLLSHMHAHDSSAFFMPKALTHQFSRQFSHDVPSQLSAAQLDPSNVTMAGDKYPAYSIAAPAGAGFAATAREKMFRRTASNPNTAMMGGTGASHEKPTSGSHLLSAPSAAGVGLGSRQTSGISLSAAPANPPIFEAGPEEENEDEFDEMTPNGETTISNGSHLETKPPPETKTFPAPLRRAETLDSSPGDGSQRFSKQMMFKKLWRGSHIGSSASSHPSTFDKVDPGAEDGKLAPPRQSSFVDPNAVFMAHRGSHDDLLRKVPMDSESAQVFVGVLPELKRIQFGLVRLAESVCMPELLDAPIPIRFLFFILGPKLVDVDYHEVGRAVSTLISNESFYETAYTAQNKEDLLNALDNFLDTSIVIPPCKIDSRSVFNIHELQKALRKRRKKKEQLKAEMHLEAKGIPVKDLEPYHDDIPSKVDVGAAPLADVESVTPRHPPTAGRAARSSTSSSSSGDRSGSRWPPLKRRGLPFYGLIQDLKVRFPKYCSDFRDAWHMQCVTSLFFMFFASFAPAIAFGGLLSEKTGDHIGVTETLLAQCVCGVIWGLFSSQPLLIMAATGPVLVFEGALYQFCLNMNVEFLVLRVWVAVWLLLMGLFVVLLEGSFLIRYVTRFTEDIFALLISLIFVYESLKFMIKNFVIYHRLRTLENYCQTLLPGGISAMLHATPGLDNLSHINSSYSSMAMPHQNVTTAAVILNSTANWLYAGNLSDSDSFSAPRAAASIGRRCLSVHTAKHDQPDTALLSAILLVITFVTSYFLKQIRTSHYFGRTLRKAIGDFGVPIAVFVACFFDFVVFKTPYLQRLHMPDSFGLTCHGRSWLVHPLGSDSIIPLWAIFAAIVPAFLVFILLFVETEITQLLMSKPERGLQKGSGFHWDMLLVAGCTLICSLFGLPWMCAAAVQSLAHVSSLTVLKKRVPGERPLVDFVIEQRVTTIGVALLVGSCCFLGVVLKYIPLAVLFGVFLYLGIMNMAGVQFLRRMALFLIPQKYFPDEPYCQLVHLLRMHLYTLIQIGCFVAVWLFKSFEKSALAFPFVMMVICLFRMFILPLIFSEPELEALDGEEPEDEEERSEYELDFYEEAHGLGF